MAQAKTRTPAIEGWFTIDAGDPRLLGSRCRSCQTCFFPRESVYCRNPHCSGEEFDEVPLSNRGTLWSFTNNCYAPPAPYVAADPFEPYAVAAVELEGEKIVVLGQVVPGVGIDALRAGMKMNLALDTLYEDEQNEYLVWKWRPAAA